MNTIPNSLFHYTTINNLALILKHRTINFNRLDKVNDPNEGKTSDFGSVAQYIFISCWTETEEENLALWNMYTPQMRGVRLELSSPIFPYHEISNHKNCLIKESDLIDEDKCLFVIPNPDPLYKIRYTDDILKLNPSIETELGLYMKDVATYKKAIWSMENEWRFRLNIFPIDPTINSRHLPDRYNHLITQRKHPSISNYQLHISEESFINMKIVTGPKLINGDKEIIEALITQYNPNASLSSSCLNGDIR